MSYLNKFTCRGHGKANLYIILYKESCIKLLFKIMQPTFLRNVSLLLHLCVAILPILFQLRCSTDNRTQSFFL